MSFETFPCGSPEAESPEEPAPSLYVENPDEEHARLLIKKPVNAEPSRLAETANIEDQMMSEDEIAQVNASGDALKLKNQETETSGKTKKNIDESERRFVEGSNVYESSRAHWMQLSYGNPAPGQTHSAIAIDHQQQGELGLSSRILDADRASVIIKRTSKGQQEVESDSDNESQDTTRKISASELRCDENISGVDANDDKLNSLSHSSRALHYNYNVHHEDVNKLEDKGNAKLQNIRGELIRAAHGEAKAVPVYYMPASTYPQMVAAMAGGNAIGNTNVLQREQHFVHAGTSEVKRFPSPRVDYVSGRPEQQVPVATSTVNANEGNVFGNLQRGAPGLQYVDRRLVHAAGGYTMVPGIGPVRVIDGMYYRGLPMGGDQSRYENFGSVPSFVPLGNIQTDTTTSQPQAQLTVSSLSNPDPVNNRGQEKLLNSTKPYASPVHPAVSPASSLEERRSTNSPAIRSDSSSPAPPSGEDPENKKHTQAKVKGKPKLTTGAAKPEIKCEQCGKTFGSSSALAKHKLTHSDERRYICSTCGKGFKRQDHLNGHMVTHRDKKPYECSYSDCDKSYCDMRSLRRHLENHHTANVNGVSDSRTPGSGSPSLNCSEKLPAGCNSAVGNERIDSPRNLSKLAKGRPLKDKTDHLQVSGYDSGRSSGRSTPGSTHEPSAPRERPSDLPLEGSTFNSLRERNSDSFSSTTSEDGVGHSTEQSVPEKVTDASTPQSAVDLLKQAADRVKVQQTARSANEMWQERFPQQPYMVYHPEGNSYQQWYPTAAVYAQDPRFVYQYHPVFPPAVYQVPVNPVSGLVPDARQRMMSDSETPTEMTKTVGVSTQATPSPSQDYRAPDTMQAAYFRQSGKIAGTPTDPTAVAVATAKEIGHYRYAGESCYGVHPSGTQWQPVRYDEATKAYNSTASMGNGKSLYSHAMTPESNGNAASDHDSNHVETLTRGTEFRSGKLDDGEPVEKRQRMSEGGSGERRDIGGPSHAHVNKLEDNNNAQDKGDDGLFRNPAQIVTPRRKQRPRPEPLTIPPSASTTYFPNRPGSPINRSRPCSPPYTPPPMLSPRSIYHVNSLGNITPRLSASLQPPMTPSRLLLSSHSHRSSFDVEEDATPFPEPKINVGTEFQANVPLLASSREGAIHDVHKATMCWKPLDEKKRTKREEIESYLDMACSVAVLGGGSNKEYALHILHRCNGNVKDAVKLLLCQKYITQPGDPMYDYHYEGSVRWASKERQVFRQNFRTKGKEFVELNKDVGDKKTIFDCIEFYYHWKAAHPEAVRGRTRYIDSDSEEDYEDTGSETNSNPSYFECDFPQCNAKFVSRQALNGHIRVHGGSFMKPSEPRRNKNRNTTGPSTNGASSGHVTGRKRKSPSPAPAAVVPDLNNPDGPLPEFACKVCGRIFHKIKSRSAHMKTHVKRPDDDEKIAAKMAASKNH